jgi:hypothetical protein
MIEVTEREQLSVPEMGWGVLFAEADNDGIVSPELHAPISVSPDTGKPALIFSAPRPHAIGVEIPLEKSVPHPNFFGDRHHCLEHCAVESRIEGHIVPSLRTIKSVGHIV